jgi:hypothetical protein
MTPKYQVVLSRETPQGWEEIARVEFESESNLAFIIDDLAVIKERNRPATDKKVKKNDSA